MSKKHSIGAKQSFIFKINHFRCACVNTSSATDVKKIEQGNSTHNLNDYLFSIFSFTANTYCMRQNLFRKRSAKIWIRCACIRYVEIETHCHWFVNKLLSLTLSTYIQTSHANYILLPEAIPHFQNMNNHLARVIYPIENYD